MKNKTMVIAGLEIAPGTHQVIALPAAGLYTQTEMGIPIHIFHGKKAGPKVFITATIHGDELDGIEIIRRLHHQKWLKHIKGTLITVPVVNLYGFSIQSRYLPDRRDLNRSFPGSNSGSLAARLANMLNEEIIRHCQYGIDLHTGAVGRANFPQLRVSLAVRGSRQLAKAFDAPVIIDAPIRDGSLRQAASELKIPVLVYEGGEALKNNELCIRVGLRGIANVLHYLGMIAIKRKVKIEKKPLITKNVQWIRAPDSGMLQIVKDFMKNLAVKKNEVLAYIHDPFLIKASQPIVSPVDGIVIGCTNLPIVNEGDATFNIATTKLSKDVNEFIEELREEMDH